MFSLILYSRQLVKLFVTATLCISSILAVDVKECVDAVSGAVNVKECFNVASGDVEGSCDTQINNLNDYLKEAFAMAEESAKGLSDLMDRKGTLSDLRLLVNLFGINLFDHTRGISAPEESVVDATYDVRDVFNAISPKGLAKMGSKPRLYCDSTFLLYTEHAYYITGEKSDTLLKEVLEEDSKNAYWFPDMKRYTGINKATETTRCNDQKLGGFNLPGLNTMVLCPKLLNGMLGLPKSISSYTEPGKVKTGTRDENGEPLMNGDNMDAFNSVPAVFLHEMSHLVGPTAIKKDIVDQNAYDWDGNLVPDTKAYTFARLPPLAGKSISLAITNADTYAYYAIGRYLNKYDWSLGNAYPLMVTVPPKPPPSAKL